MNLQIVATPLTFIEKGGVFVGLGGAAADLFALTFWPLPWAER